MNIKERWIDVLNESYTTLVVRNNSLYERYYATYDKPEYTLLIKNLSPAQLKECEELGIK